MATTALTLETMDTVEDTAGVAEGSNAYASQVVYQIYGTWSGTITFEATINGDDWIAVKVKPLDTGTMATTTSDSGLFRVDASGLVSTRCRFSTDTSGTVEVMTVWIIG